MQPRELRDDELVAYMDGEAADEIAQIVAETPRYQERVAELTRLQDQVRQRLRPTSRPSSMELGEYALGLLPPDRARAVAAYLRRHPHAARELADLQEFLSEPAAGTTSERASALQQVKLFVATLLQAGDGGWQPALAGVRGPLEQVYQAGEIRIVVETDEERDDPTRKVLSGLVMGVESSGLHAHLWHADDPGSETVVELDEFGNFLIPLIAPGRYQLTIRGDDPPLEIHISDIQV